MIRESRRYASRLNRRSSLSQRGRLASRHVAISDERLGLQENLAMLAGQVGDFMAALEEAQELIPTRGRFAPRNLQEVARLLKLIKDGITEQGGFLDTAKETFELAHGVAGPRVRPNSRLRHRPELD